MAKYRVEFEIELELLPDAELDRHADEMEIARHELDLGSPSAEFLAQQIEDGLFGHVEADEALFAGSDVFWKLKHIATIRTERLDTVLPADPNAISR